MCLILDMQFFGYPICDSNFDDEVPTKWGMRAYTQEGIYASAHTVTLALDMTASRETPYKPLQL